MALELAGLQGATVNNLSIGSNLLLQERKVVQTRSVRSDVVNLYTAQPSGNGTEINELRIGFTPYSANSWIWIRYTIHYEMHHDTVFLVLQDSSLIGYNRQRGNVRHSGILTPAYDNDYNSTPQCSTINWFVKAGTTSYRVYAPAVRSSSGGTYTFGFNRALGSVSNNYEVGSSYGWIREIYQP